MTAEIQGTSPQPGTPQAGAGPFAAIRQHFEKHGTIYLIILGAAGLFVAVLVWQNNQSGPAVPASTTGSTDQSGATQADYNSILQAIEGIQSQLGQNNGGGGDGSGGGGTGKNLGYTTTGKETISWLAKHFGYTVAQFEQLPGVWSLIVGKTGNWNIIPAGEQFSLPIGPAGEWFPPTSAQIASHALQPKTAGTGRSS